MTKLSSSFLRSRELIIVDAAVRDELPPTLQLRGPPGRATHPRRADPPRGAWRVALQLVLLELERERAERHLDQHGRACLDSASRNERLCHPLALELAELVGDRAEGRFRLDRARRVLERWCRGRGGAAESLWQVV